MLGSHPPWQRGYRLGALGADDRGAPTRIAAERLVGVLDAVAFGPWQCAFRVEQEPIAIGGSHRGGKIASALPQVSDRTRTGIRRADQLIGPAVGQLSREAG